MTPELRRRLRRARPSLVRARIRRGYRRTIERFVTRWPRTHMGVIVGLSALGFLYLLSFPLAALLLLTGLPARVAGLAGPVDWVMLAGVVMLIALLGLVSWQIARLRFTLPGAEVLEPGEAPVLFDTIDELCRLFRTAPVHRIVLSERFEVEMIRTPRFGYPFAFTNTLMVGLPVLLSLSPQQARVLMARRIGQLAAPHGVPGSWVYVLARVWPRYRRDAASAPRPLSWLLRAFFPWYVPLLRRLSRRAARQAELDADARLLTVIDDQEVAEALAASTLRQRYLDEVFWPRLQPDQPAAPQPRSFPYARMTAAIRALGPQKARQWLDRALSEADSGRGELPGLRARLDHIGHGVAPVPGPLEEAAAGHYLEASLAARVRRMDSLWFRGIMPAWRERYERRQRSLRHIRALAEKAKGGRLSVQEARGYAVLAERLLPGAQTCTVYRQLLTMGVPDAELNLRIGRYLLARGDEMGVVALERVAAYDRTFARAAARVLARFFSERGQPEAASRYLKEALAAQAS